MEDAPVLPVMRRAETLNSSTRCHVLKIVKIGYGYLAAVSLASAQIFVTPRHLGYQLTSHSGQNNIQSSPSTRMPARNSTPLRRMSGSSMAATVTADQA
jgi:hypothetical protein